MGILRKDYILERWVFYAAERKNRPMEFRKSYIVNNKKCFFCPGHEHLTPKEIGRVEHKDIWKIRWFPNKFPAVEIKGSGKITSRKKFLIQGKNYGMHEIIAETRDHKRQLADLSVDHISEILKVYALRIKALSRVKGIKYVTVFKNHGPHGGTSLVHSHTQVAAMSILPKAVNDEIKAFKKSRKCLYCNIINLERKSKRKIFENKTILAFAPFASRFNYEAWLFPKKHRRNITDFNQSELKDLASILKKILLKLKKINASYNYYLHCAPQGSDLHFHIELTPRLHEYGGFELSTGAIINSVLPEDAAKFYKSR